MYAPPVLALTLRHYAVMILVITLFYRKNSIHEQRPRFRNSFPIDIDLHDTLSTAIMAVPLILNGPSEVVTRLYLVLIFLGLNYPYFLLYILVNVFQLLFTSASPMIAIPLLIMI